MPFFLFSSSLLCFLSLTALSLLAAQALFRNRGSLESLDLKRNLLDDFAVGELFDFSPKRKLCKGRLRFLDLRSNRLTAALGPLLARVAQAPPRGQVSRAGADLGQRGLGATATGGGSSSDSSDSSDGSDGDGDGSGGGGGALGSVQASGGGVPAPGSPLPWPTAARGGGGGGGEGAAKKAGGGRLMGLAKFRSVGKAVAAVSGVSSRAARFEELSGVPTEVCPLAPHI